MVKATYRVYRVHVNRERCGDPMSCRICLESCPQSVFTAYPKGGRRRRDVKSNWTIHPGFGALCDGCGQCINVCPNNAIEITNRARSAVRGGP